MLRVLLITFMILSVRPALADDKVYSFAIVPQQALSELADTWIPFVNWLAAQSGIKLRFVTAPDIPTFEQKLNTVSYDIAYMNPFSYVVLHDRVGYQALAKEKGRKLKGMIVVAKDSEITDISELNDSTIVFPAPTAFAATALPRAALKQAGIHIKPRYVASHESVYLNVAEGKYPAGGGVNRTFYMLDERTRDKLRILWITPDYTPHAIATSPNVPTEVIQALRHTLINMDKDPTGLALLKRIGFTGIESAIDSDWDDIRQLHITPDEGAAK